MGYYILDLKRQRYWQRAEYYYIIVYYTEPHIGTR
jgi:hypothetical protein